MSQPPTSLQGMLIAYIQGPDQLEDALNGLSDTDLDKRGSDGWSIRQIVHHLTDGDASWSLFMKGAIIAPGSTFSFDWYRSNDIASQALHYAERPIEPALQLFRANRTLIAQMLPVIPDVESKYIQIDTSSNRSGVQKIFVPHIIRLLTQHAQEHVVEIQRLRNM